MPGGPEGLSRSVIQQRFILQLGDDGLGHLELAGEVNALNMGYGRLERIRSFFVFDSVSKVPAKWVDAGL